MRLAPLLVLAFASCSQSASSGARHCVPNTIVLCQCEDSTLSGTRRCDAEGGGLGACVCEARAPRRSSAATAAAGSVAAAAVGGTSAAGSGTPAAGNGTSVATSSEPPVVSTADLITEPSDEAAYLFDQSVVRTYNIIIADADLQKIAVQPSAELYVPAMLEFEGKTLGPFNARYKGNSFGAPCTTGGPDEPKGGKCSMKLDFNAQDDNARFRGLKKLNFHSMGNDESMLRDRLAYTLFREMGIAAPRSMHARLLVNGKLEGLFMVVEQVDGTYTKTRFKDGGKGNLYKEVWPVSSEESVYLENLVTNEKDQPTVMGMLAFKAAVDRGPDAVKTLLDRDYLLRYLAVDRVIINDDGVMHFWCEGPGSKGYNGNFYWYEAPTHDKFWLVPWDMDESFDGFPAGRVSPEWSKTAACSCSGSGTLYSLPASCDKLTQTLITWLPDYRAQVEAFVAGPFAPAAVDAKLNAWSQQISPFVDETAGKNSAPDVDEWRAAVAELKAIIASAREHRGLAY